MKRAIIILVLLALLLPRTALANDSALWAALKSGNHVVLIRHALAPGGGDPPGFRLRDCTTQRNLSDTGRAQARRIGEIFRRNGMPVARVHSSQWCRCLETARLMALGKLTELPALNSFFGQYENRAPQTQALRAWIAAADLSPGKPPVMLVTHQVNISALTGRGVASGEMVFVKRSPKGELSAAGTIATGD